VSFRFRPQRSLPQRPVGANLMIPPPRSKRSHRRGLGFCPWVFQEYLIRAYTCDLPIECADWFRSWPACVCLRPERPDYLFENPQEPRLEQCKAPAVTAPWRDRQQTAGCRTPFPLFDRSLALTTWMMSHDESGQARCDRREAVVTKGSHMV
jgi:hypothetical protein